MARAFWAAVALCAGGAAGAPFPSAAVPCTTNGLCTDNEGTVWDIGTMAGGGLGRVHRVAGAYQGDDSTYTFSLYNNLNIIPDVCTDAGITTASAMRYEVATDFCEPIGPDMTADPSYTVTRTAMGITFDYQLGGSDTLRVNLRCVPGGGVGQPDTATGFGTGRTTINWRNGFTCPGVQPLCTDAGMCTDNEGTVWNIGNLPGGGLNRIQRVAGPEEGYVYSFRLYTNLNVLPDVCSFAGLTTASGLRYNRGTSDCTQIMPNMENDPSYAIRRVPTGLLFVYQLDDETTMEINLICREGMGVGLPDDAKSPVPGLLTIDWFNGLTCLENQNGTAGH